jgi:hypothetical protein
MNLTRTRIVYEKINKKIQEYRIQIRDNGVPVRNERL